MKIRAYNEDNKEEEEKQQRSLIWFSLALTSEAGDIGEMTLPRAFPEKISGVVAKSNLRGGNYRAT